VKTNTRYIAPLLVAAAIGGAIGFAPVALADAGTAGAPQSALQKAAAVDPIPSPAPSQTGGDPQVPYGPTVNFNADNFDGNSLAY
jgi:hypothetical protein